MPRGGPCSLGAASAGYRLSIWRPEGASPSASTLLVIKFCDSVECVSGASASYRKSPMTRRHQRRRFRPIPEQLSLPLGCSVLAHAAPSRSRARSKGKRWPWPRVLPATNPAMHGRPDSVPAALGRNKPINSFRQPQRFSLTPVISALIYEVNGKRWPYAATLSPFCSRPVALVSDRRAHVRGRRVAGVQAYPLVGHTRRTGLPPLRLPR